MHGAGFRQRVRNLYQRLCKGMLPDPVIARTDAPNYLIDKSPRELNRVEVRRIGRQVQQMALRFLDKSRHLASMMNVRVVHYQTEPGVSCGNKSSERKCSKSVRVIIPG